jgi:hypothetical protein|tara:strand:- start:395 stop:535 length:141 start_codon:yes stop_codon:yes gene_type:complete
LNSTPAIEIDLGLYIAKTGTIKKIRKENKKRTKAINKRTKETRKHQ